MNHVWLVKGISRDGKRFNDSVFGDYETAKGYVFAKFLGISLVSSTTTEGYGVRSLVYNEHDEPVAEVVKYKVM